MRAQVLTGLVTQGASPGIATRPDGSVLVGTVIVAGEPRSATVYEFRATTTANQL